MNTNMKPMERSARYKLFTCLANDILNRVGRGGTGYSAFGAGKEAYSMKSKAVYAALKARGYRYDAPQKEWVK